MTLENSTFGNTEPSSLFTEIQTLYKNGATSDTYKVKIYGKWHFLKRPKKEYKSNPIYIAAFEKEFDLGFQLDHPNIVRYHSKGTDNLGFFIVTEYVEGLNLSEYINENPNCFNDKRFVKKIVLQILSILDYLHNNQIIHLDLKPENILITGKGQNVKLIDLGFSSSDAYDSISSGTPEFSSPEQFGYPTTTDARNDIYAFGNVLIYMFTGNILPGSIGKLPQPYKDISKKCRWNDPSLRYANISAIVRQIESHQKKKTTLASISGVLVFILLAGFGLQLLNQIWNEKTKKYNELYNQIQLSSQKQTSSDEAKLRKSIREKLDKLYQPLNDYKEITKNNVEASQKLYEQLYYKALNINKELSDQLKNNKELSSQFDEIFMRELDAVVSSYSIKKSQFNNTLKY